MSHSPTNAQSTHNNPNSPTPAELPNAPSPVSEKQVALYLQQHPEFFEKHLDLLLQVRLPHPSGSAISLIEKQVHTFRERNSNIRERLNILLGNARDNDRLFELSQRLTLALIECSELGDIFDALNYSLNQEFKVPHAAIWVLDKKLNSATTQFLHTTEFQPALNKRLNGSKTAFSGISQPEINALFRQSEDVGSAALCVVHHGSRPIALIAVGHPDKERYLPNGGTLFLRHLSELLSRILARYV
ncbi:DUF484 family protein [Marinagarivorans algicola]|uniref:DUF484 family protein n=1 Tax=Marinagarivorans algicola TaxID=1513270 RepID=UPI0009E8FF84|nr:DUF484 family protein [Marinagarivorans algicola]